AGFTPITSSSIPAGDPGSSGFGPWGVSVDPANGELIGGDRARGEIDLFEPDGTFVSQFAVPGVYGVASGANGEIYTTGNLGAQAWSPGNGYSTPTLIDRFSLSSVACDHVSHDVCADDS